MARVDFMPFTPEEIPIGKRFNIEGTRLLWEIRLNEEHQFYTLYLRDQDGVLIYTMKVVYGIDLLNAIASLEITKLIKAFDFTGANDTVTPENFNNPVKIYVLDQ